MLPMFLSLFREILLLIWNMKAISAGFINLYVLVRIYVGFHYLMMIMCFYVGLHLCDVPFSCSFLVFLWLTLE
jgi:hypothetical protein